MRHTSGAFLSSMLLLSMFTHIAIFSHNALYDSNVANKYIAAFMLERGYSTRFYYVKYTKAIDIYRPNSVYGKLADTSVERFQAQLISFHPSISERRSPQLSALQARWPDAQKGRGKNNVIGYEQGV